MEFHTSISKMTPDDHIIRGEKLSQLMKENSFAQVIYLLLKGEKPSAKEAAVFEAALISVIDHGMGTTSSMTARFAASGGNSVNASVAAGIIALGDYHGGAIEKAMEQFRKISLVKDFVADALKNKKIIYGFGHSVYKNRDPRVKEILLVCDKVNF